MQSDLLNWFVYFGAVVMLFVIGYMFLVMAGVVRPFDQRPDASAAIKEALAEQPAKLKVTLEDRPVDIELAQYKRMFEAACSALGQIGDALGCDPEEGGAEPILAAIAELKAQQPAQQNHSAHDLDMVKAREIALAYSQPNSGIDSGNLYWALNVALSDHIGDANKMVEQQLSEPCRCGKQTNAWCMANTCSKAEQPTSSITTGETK